MANQNRHPFQPPFMQPVGATMPPVMHAVGMGIAPQQPGINMVGMPAFHGMRPGMWPQQIPMVPAVRKPTTTQSWPQGAPQDWKEQQQKEREYLKQQQKLRAMASIRKEPVSADALIENMFGKRENIKPKSQKVPPMNNEFTVVKNSESQVKESTDKIKQTNANGSSSSTNVMPAVPQPAAKPEVKLESLMMAYSDLSSGGKAKTFCKPSVRDIKVARPSSGMSYTPSQKACDWSRVDAISSVFNTAAPVGNPPSQDAFGSAPVGHGYPSTQGKGGTPLSPPVTPPVNHAPTSPPPTFSLPVWITNKSHVPPAYQQMWEYVKDGVGMVDTTKIFPLLLGSGLPREVLGYIWSVANQKVPGQLTEEELYIVLALVGLAQAGCTFNNLNVLNLIPQAPLPNLSASACVPPAVQADASPRPPVQPPKSDAQQPLSSAEEKRATTASQMNTPATTDDDEFTDFQSADTSAPPTSVNRGRESHSPSPPDTFHNPIFQESPPTSPSLSSATASPIMLPRYQTSGGHGVGSRLANYSLGTPRASDTRPIVEQPRSTRSLEVRSSRDDEDDDDFCDFQQASVLQNTTSEKYLHKEPEKTISKPVPTTFVLKESVIRNVESFPRESEVKSEVQPKTEEDSLFVEDKYSALRELALMSENCDEQQQVSSSSSGGDNNENGDDGFGDFVAAPSDDSFAEIAKERASVDSATTATTVNAFSSFSTFPATSEQESQEWRADFDSFNTVTSSSSVAAASTSIKPSSWTQDITSKPMSVSSSGNNTSSKPVTVFVDEVPDAAAAADDDDDFGDFVGPETAPKEPNVICENNIVHKLRELSPEQQSVSSLELGGFDTLSIGEGRLGDNLSLGDAQPTLSRQGSLPSLDLKVFGEETGEAGTAQGSTLPAPSVVPLVGEKYSIEPWDSAQKIAVEIQETEPAIIDKAHTSPSKLGDRHTYEWQRCLQSCLNLLQAAYEIFGSITSVEVVEEVVSTVEGKDYLSNLLEVYCVSQRIRLSCKQLGADPRLEKLLNDIACIWENLKPFYDKSDIEVETEDEIQEDVLQENTCGVCLTNVEFSNSREKAHQLTYGGHLYHSTCANLWVNCVDCLLPGLPRISLL